MQTCGLYKKRIFQIECACAGSFSFFKYNVSCVTSRAPWKIGICMIDPNSITILRGWWLPTALPHSRGPLGSCASVSCPPVTAANPGESWVTDMTAPLATCRRPLVAYANRVFVLQKGTWFFYVGEHDSLVSRPLVRHVGQPRVRTGSGDDEKTPPLTGHVSQLSRPYRNRHLADQIQLPFLYKQCCQEL